MVSSVQLEFKPPGWGGNYCPERNKTIALSPERVSRFGRTFKFCQSITNKSCVLCARLHYSCAGPADSRMIERLAARPFWACSQERTQICPHFFSQCFQRGSPPAGGKALEHGLKPSWLVWYSRGAQGPNYIYSRDRIKRSSARLRVRCCSHVPTQ